jgi:hypothetical protein
MTNALLDQVDGGEETNPHHIDEVPIVGNHYCLSCLRMSEPTSFEDSGEQN